MPSRLDYNRNAYPCTGIGGTFLIRKTPFLHCKNSVVSWCQTEKTPAVPDPQTCNSSASRPEAFAPRLPPTFSGSRPMADFRHTAFAVSVHPCAHSAVRGGFFPFPSKLPPDQLNLIFAADSRTTSPDRIQLTNVVYHPVPILVNDIRKNTRNSLRSRRARQKIGPPVGLAEGPILTFTYRGCPSTDPPETWCAHPPRPRGWAHR